jgi:hypothetical protein
MFLCDGHSLSGGHVLLTFEPSNVGEIVIDAQCRGVTLEQRVKAIRQPLVDAA